MTDRLPPIRSRLTSPTTGNQHAELPSAKYHNCIPYNSYAQSSLRTHPHQALRVIINSSPRRHLARRNPIGIPPARQFPAALGYLDTLCCGFIEKVYLFCFGFRFLWLHVFGVGWVVVRGYRRRDSATFLCASFTKKKIFGFWWRRLGVLGSFFG